MNLLDETLEILHEYKRSEKDVIWCGSYSFGWFTWEDFKQIANVEYDSRYGSQKVAEDLIICGNDFWLERHEYDGSEWWEYKTTPEKPKKYTKPTALTIQQAREKGFNISVGWEDLNKINNIVKS